MSILDDLLNRPAWQARAECRHYDPSLFFPVGSGRPSKHYRSLIDSVCGPCPVRAECLEFAMSLEVDTPGVWGGTTHPERMRMRKAAALRVVTP